MYMFGEINCLLIKFQVVILKCNANCIGTKMNEETSPQLLLCIFDMRNTFKRNLIERHSGFFFLANETKLTMVYNIESFKCLKD